MLCPAWPAALEFRREALEAQRFAAVTRFQGQATMAQGASTYLGSAVGQAPFPSRVPPPEPGDGSLFAGEQRPTPLSELQVAFQQQAAADHPNTIGLYKL